MDSEQLEFAFQLHGIGHDDHARRFYTNLWHLIQSAEKIRDPSQLTEVQKDLRRLCRDYFAFMAEWRADEEERHDDTICCALSRSNAREALATLEAYERQFYRYALCYLELNRELIHARAQIGSLSKNYNVDDLVDTLQVNHATGEILQRAHKDRKTIMEKRLRLDRIKSLLRHFDPLLESLGANLPRIMGHEEGSRQLTLFKGAVRKQHFVQAGAIVSGWSDLRLKASALKIIDMAQKNTGELTAQDGLVLHSGELGLITAFLKSDEERINAFVDKYNVPYMVFQYKNLLHQGYLLGRVGSIEGLIIHHAKLLSLAARVHNDPDYAKKQEQTILIPTRALMGRFKTLGPIFNEMEITTATLNKLFTQTREYMANTPAEGGN